MDATILNGVGKKARNQFLRGELPEEKLLATYRHYKKEADSFSAYGRTAQELSRMLRDCHNPILKSKIEDCITQMNAKSKASSDQNKVSIEKLANFMETALGVGLRKVISVMKNEARKSKDCDLKIVTMLLETEFANLCAKNHGKQLKNTIYERKNMLLTQLSDVLYGTDWKYGYNDNSGKNASYIVYIYLPNGVQLSWHRNDYSTSLDYPYIDAEWDGLVCATLEKLLDYIGEKYDYFFADLPIAA